MEVDGSGTYLGSDLTSHTSDVQIDGSGNAHVNAIGPLDAEVNGSGHISYSGTPLLTTHIYGNGTVSAS